MLAFFRLLFAALWIIPSLLITLIACVFRPFSPDNIYLFAILWGPIVAKVFNLKFELRQHHLVEQERPCLFIANHQTNWDLLIACIYRMRRTVSLGKIEIFFIPLFGLFYWLSGNIVVDRKNRSKSRQSMLKVKNLITRKKMAILIMPEGTRSHGKGLGPFKKGAFHTAKEVNIPIYPLCISSWHRFVDLNRWRAGTVIVEVLDPVSPKIFAEMQMEQVIEQTRNQMQEKINQLDRELEARS